jgi:hypothetical protein
VAVKNPVKNPLTLFSPFCYGLRLPTSAVPIPQARDDYLPQSHATAAAEPACGRRAILIAPISWIGTGRGPQSRRRGTGVGRRLRIRQGLWITDAPEPLAAREV